jgi:tmRNA-binding protein
VQEYTVMSLKNQWQKDNMALISTEVMAIWQALKEFNKLQLARKNVVLLIDSVAAIQAVANEDSQDKKVILARYEIKSLQTKVVKEWVPPNPLQTARK